MDTGPSSRRSAVLFVAVSLAVIAVVAGLAYTVRRAGPVDPGAFNRHPVGAPSAESAVTTFFDALERGDGASMRDVMTTMAQGNEDIAGGLLQRMPTLTSYRILRAPEREAGQGNAAPPGSLDSLRYTVALTPSKGYDYDEGSAYPVPVAESPRHRWYVAELGGCC